MPTTGHTAQTEQRILNDSKDSLYDTLAVTPFLETTSGSVAQRATATVTGAKVGQDVHISSSDVSMGGGTQYTEGDTDATITGTALMFRSESPDPNSIHAVSVSNPLPIRSDSTLDVAVTGEVATSTKGTIAEGAAASDPPVLFGGEDNSGNIANLQTNAAKDLKVTLDSESVAVTGTFYQATQPVSLASVPSHEVTNAGTFATQATITPLTSCGSGVTTVTTAGTQVALGSSTAIDSVTIKALSTNTGLIYVGTSTVSSADGFQLSAGDSVSLDVDNLTDVYIDSAVNAEGVSYIWVT